MISCSLLLFVSLLMESRTEQETPVSAAFHVFSSGMITVKVGGDVRHQGIYNVPANSLAVSVIKMAEPLQPQLQNESGQYALKPLSHGAAVMLAIQPDGSHLVTVNQMSVPERMVLGIPLDIRGMSEEDFDRLPGIGPALARRIIEYRQNNGGNLRVSDLAMIEGIGEKKYKSISKYFQLP